MSAEFLVEFAVGYVAIILFYEKKCFFGFVSVE